MVKGSETMIPDNNGCHWGFGSFPGPLEGIFGFGSVPASSRGDRKAYDGGGTP